MMVFIMIFVIGVCICGMLWPCVARLIGYDWYMKVWCRHRWEYTDYPDVYLQQSNLRCCRTCESIQLLDVDGWSQMASPEQANRMYGMTRSAYDEGIHKIRRAVGLTERSTPCQQVHE